MFGTQPVSTLQDVHASGRFRGTLRPVVSAQHKARIEQWIQTGVDEGAELETRKNR